MKHRLIGAARRSAVCSFVGAQAVRVEAGLSQFHIVTAHPSFEVGTFTCFRRHGLRARADAEWRPTGGEARGQAVALNCDATMGLAVNQTSGDTKYHNENSG